MSPHARCVDQNGAWLPCDRLNPDCLAAARARSAAERAAYQAAWRPWPCVRGCGRLTRWGTGERCGACVREEAGRALAALLPLLAPATTDPFDHPCAWCRSPLSVCCCAASDLPTIV